MSRLRNALLAIQRGDTKAGSVAFSDAAIGQLSAIQRNLALQGWLIFIAVFAGATLAIWAAALNVHDAKGLAAVSSALGLSVGGALEMLRRTWRELGRTNLLLTLLDNASEAQVAALIDKLIKDLPA
jgi:hypothetical protein